VIRKLLPWLLLLAVSVGMSGANNYLLTVATVTALWGILAIGLNLLMGYSGLIHLGLGAFYALGAYGATILGTQHDVSAIVIVLVLPVIAFVLGLAIGAPLLRTRGLHFAVATLGIGIIVSDITENWISVTKGPIGMGGIQRPAGLSVGGLKLDFTTTAGFFGLCVGVLALVLVLATVYHRSRLARVLVAARDDELLTGSLGFSVMPYRLFAFAASGAVAALAGVLYAWFIRYISPPPFTFFAASFPVFVLVAVGGSGSVWGPVVGAAVLTGLPEFLEVEANNKLIIYGLVLLAIVIVLPRGLAPTVSDFLRTATDRLLRRARPKRAQPDHSTTTVQGANS
jgi:branched-chain amino acid transport system permease protein